MVNLEKILKPLRKAVIPLTIAIASTGCFGGYQGNPASARPGERCGSSYLRDGEICECRWEHSGYDRPALAIGPTSGGYQERRTRICQPLRID